MDLRSAEGRYHNDPTFHTLVEIMVQGLEQLQFTAAELREAAMFAAMLCEQRRERRTPWAVDDESRKREYVREEAQRFLLLLQHCGVAVPHHDHSLPALAEVISGTLRSLVPKRTGEP